MRLTGRTVLVTGGAGFVGSHLVRRLLGKGSTVHVVDNQFTGHRDRVPQRVTFHDVDIRSAELATVVETVDPEILFHLAAHHYIPYCNENPEEAFTVNVMGTRQLLQAARDLETLQRVVYASTAAVYRPADEPHHETEIEGPTDIYGRTKLVGEDLVELFAANTGIPSTAARLFNIYGPDETNDHLIPAVLDQIRDGQREIELGNLEPARDFIHVDDVTAAMLGLATDFNGEYRAYNVGTGTEWTVREVVECVSDALGEDLSVSQTRDRIRESDRPHLRPSTDRIEREIGWHAAVEFVDGLRRLLETERIIS